MNELDVFLEIESELGISWTAIICGTVSTVWLAQPTAGSGRRSKVERPGPTKRSLQGLEAAGRAGM